METNELGIVIESDTKLLSDKQWKRVPFDIELAKKIQSGEVEGRIVTNEGNSARIICFDAYKRYTDNEIIALVKYNDIDNCDEAVGRYKRNGELVGKSVNDDDLVIELPEETPKHEFKPFDRVLVRDSHDASSWKPSLFVKYYPCAMDGKEYFETIGEHFYELCIPYEGHEHLAGTTYKP